MPRGRKKTAAPIAVGSGLKINLAVPALHLFEYQRKGCSA
jgi:hypothetical protein